MCEFAADIKTVLDDLRFLQQSFHLQNALFGVFLKWVLFGVGFPFFCSLKKCSKLSSPDYVGKVSHGHHGLLDGLLPWHRGPGRREPHEFAGSVLGERKQNILLQAKMHMYAHVVKLCFGCILADCG